MEKKYYVVDGTSFAEGTPVNVAKLLAEAIRKCSRVRVFYGDRKTGKDWHDVYDAVGRVGRSTGPIKIPLLIKTRRSIGGGAIMTDAIVRLQIDGRDVWKAPRYNANVQLDAKNECKIVESDGKEVVVCKTPDEAQRLLAFYLGNRMRAW